MAMRKLRDFLDNNQVQYSTISHATAYTSQHIAAAAHISGHQLAKTVMLKLNGELAMLVLPSNRRADLEALCSMLDCNDIEIAREYEFSDCFPDCETGAMPPFGNLFDMRVFVDSELDQEKDIAFNAGNHNELIRMSFTDFAELVDPVVLRKLH